MIARWPNVVSLACVALVVTARLRAADEAPSLSYEAVAFGPQSYPRTVFAVDESPLIQVRLTGAPSAPPPHLLHARVLNFWGEAAGPVQIDPTGSSTTFILRPKVRGTGWFRIELGWGEADPALRIRRRGSSALAMEAYDYLPFAVVPRPRSSAELPESPFGVDTAITTSKGYSVPELLDLAAWTGCRWARERLPWIQPTSDPHTIRWEPARSVVHELGRRGFRVLEAFHSAPGWSRSEGNLSFPSDLMAAYQFAHRAVLALGPEVKASEVWNEEDIAFFAKDPPDQYASLVKAMSLGFKSGIHPPLVNLGPFARHPEVGGYAEVLKSNEIAASVDAYDFHTYAPFEGMHFEQVLSTHRDVATRLEFAAKPLWLTEVGRVYARKTGDRIDAAPEAQAKYLVRAYVTALAMKISPVFWFILHPDFESSQQFGLLDSTLSPFPAYAALAVMTNQLGPAIPAGSVALPGAEARLFRNGSSICAVIISDMAGKIALPALSEEARAFDIMGQPVPLEKTGAGAAIVSRGFPIYIQNPGWSAAEPSSDRPPEKPEQGQSSAEPASVVLRFHFPAGQVAFDTDRSQKNWDGLASNWAPRGYWFMPGQKIAATLEVYNFGEAEQHGELRFQLPAGFACEPSRLAVRVPPMAKATVRFSLRAPRSPDANAVMVVCRAAFGGNASAVVAAQWLPRSSSLHP